MNDRCAPIWLFPHTDIRDRIQAHIYAALDRIVANDTVYVFFRADDIAPPSKNFNRIMDLFSHYRVPLSLAIVPAWLTKPRWLYLKDLIHKDPSLWCLHQHGWRHTNHEDKGKKQEFGKSRSIYLKKADIVKGKEHLEKHMGQNFQPFFTPPWNRCDTETLKILKNLEFQGISRMKNKSPKQNILREFHVHVDLHTRIEKNPRVSMDNLLKELTNHISRGICGIMIHHQKMNDFSFHFLEFLIKELLSEKKIQTTTLGELPADSGVKNPDQRSGLLPKKKPYRLGG